MHWVKVDNSANAPLRNSWCLWLHFFPRRNKSLPSPADVSNSTGQTDFRNSFRRQCPAQVNPQRWSSYQVMSSLSRRGQRSHLSPQEQSSPNPLRLTFRLYHYMIPSLKAPVKRLWATGSQIRLAPSLITKRHHALFHNENEQQLREKSIFTLSSLLKRKIKRKKQIEGEWLDGK